MDDQMRKEVMEVCTTACEKHTANNELVNIIISIRPSYKNNNSPAPCIFQCAKAIKEILDKKFGASWHVVVGEGFGFELSYEVKKLLYMFFAGSLAVCVWKCS